METALNGWNSVTTILWANVTELASISLAFLIVVTVGILMFYLINGIYLLAFILIQIIIGDGPQPKSKSSKCQLNFYQRVYQKILKQIWKSKYHHHHQDKSQ